MISKVPIFVFLFVSYFSATAQASVHWVFLHYHKTGHDLAAALIQFVKSRTTTRTVTVWDKKKHSRVNIAPHIASMTEDIIFLHATDLPFNWEEAFNVENREYRLIHFVRDPFDTLLSGYLYHAQHPSPASESWERRHDFHPCSETALSGRVRMPHSHYMNELKDVIANISSAEALLSNARRLCNELYDKYRLKPKWTYDKVLWQAKGLNSQFNEDGEFPALQLEVSRAFISAEGSDMLRMAANAIRESQATRNCRRNADGSCNWLRMYLSAFPWGNQSVYLQSVEKVFAFLMRESRWSGGSGGQSDSTFWKSLGSPHQAATEFVQSITSQFGTTSSAETTATAAQSTVKTKENLKEPLSPAGTPGASRHVTSDLMTASDRLRYVALLKADKVLGPLIAIVQRALDYTPSSR